MYKSKAQNTRHRYFWKPLFSQLWHFWGEGVWIYLKYKSLQEPSKGELHSSLPSTGISPPSASWPRPPWCNLARLLPQCIASQVRLSAWHSLLPLEGWGHGCYFYPELWVAQYVCSLLFPEAGPVCLGKAQGLWAWSNKPISTKLGFPSIGGH